jgi:hypothetical protein
MSVIPRPPGVSEADLGTGDDTEDFLNRQGNAVGHASDHPAPRNAWVTPVLQVPSGAPESRAWWYRRAECVSESSWAAQRQLST